MKSNDHLFQSMINDWLAVKRGPGDPEGGFNPGEDVNAVRQVIRKSQNRSLQKHYEEVFLPPSDDFFSNLDRISRRRKKIVIVKFLIGGVAKN